jgi:hypothetical protein
MACSIPAVEHSHTYPGDRKNTQSFELSPIPKSDVFCRVSNHQTQNASIMCQHHIMLYRKCDHTFHATAPCSDILKHKDCSDPPENKLPKFSWSSHDIDMQADWCPSCAPLALEVSGTLANRGLCREILEKLTTAGVRRQLSGNASGLWFAGPGCEYQTCTCCSKMFEVGQV